MNERNGLTDLKSFEPSSTLASEDPVVQASALSALARGIEGHRPVRRRVTDMLSVVLALSSRTRRMVHPPVAIDLDVFGPTGQRALRLYLPNRN